MTRFYKEHSYFISGLIFLVLFFLILTRYSGFMIPFMSLITVGGIGLVFYMAGIRWSFHLVILTLPFSMNIPISENNQVMFPSELLITAFAFTVVLYWIRNNDWFVKWLKQPATLALLGYILCLTGSILFSEMIVVSIKSVIIKWVYFIAFYGGACLYFRNENTFGKYVNYYLLTFIAIILLIIIRHADFSFSKDVTGFITKPFYQDHTIYSAAIAFMIPLMLFEAWQSIGLKKIAFIFVSLLLVTALILAASRAAWLSVGVAFVFWLMIKSRIPRMVISFMILLGSIFIFSKSDEILLQMRFNRSDSGARNAGIEEQTKSVVNITNDQSNAERINRWKCALRMFREKPLTGFGPGTYQFQYLPFQRESEMTRISVKSPYNIMEGRGGTAHNEFLLVLSESGIGAALFFLLAVLITFAKGIRHCYETKTSGFHLAMLIAFTTFIVHSLFNNFLDTDKIAVFFFTSIAFFAVLTTSKQSQHGEG